MQWLADHGDALFAFAFSCVRRAEVAEDLVQETLLAALTQSVGFDSRSSPRTWLIGILRHKIVDYFRRKRRTATTNDALAEIVDRTFGPSGKWVHPPATWRIGGRVLERPDVLAALQSCLSRLPSRVGEVFVLREHGELKVEVLCQVFDTTPTNIWTMLYRARTAMRECLERSFTERRQSPPR